MELNKLQVVFKKYKELSHSFSPNSIQIPDFNSMGVQGLSTEEIVVEVGKVR